MKTNKTDLERFNEKWIEVNGCWEWQAGKQKQGYGLFAFKLGTLAHRCSWMLYCGEIPKGLIVMHICDNVGCVNPLHLRLGTDKDNTRDMLEKGRHTNQKKLVCPKCQGEWTLCKSGTRTKRRCKSCEREYKIIWGNENREHKNAVKKAWRAKRRAMGLPRV